MSTAAADPTTSRFGSWSRRLRGAIAEPPATTLTGRRQVADDHGRFGIDQGVGEDEGVLGRNRNELDVYAPAVDADQLRNAIAGLGIFEATMTTVTIPSELG